jgi:hypothetical protein
MQHPAASQGNDAFNFNAAPERITNEGLITGIEPDANTAIGTDRLGNGDHLECQPLRLEQLFSGQSMGHRIEKEHHVLRLAQGATSLAAVVMQAAMSYMLETLPAASRSVKLK